MGNTSSTSGQGTLSDLMDTGMKFMVGENATKPLLAPKYNHYTAPGVFTRPDQKRAKRETGPSEEGNDEIVTLLLVFNVKNVGPWETRVLSHYQ